MLNTVNSALATERGVNETVSETYQGNTDAKHEQQGAQTNAALVIAYRFFLQGHGGVVFMRLPLGHERSGCIRCLRQAIRRQIGVWPRCR